MMKRENVSLVWLLVLMLVISAGGVVVPGSAAAQELLPASERLEALLDPIVQEAMEQDHIPGVAVVVTQGDRIRFKKGFGYADLERQVVLDPDRTIMPVGSLTKSLTATAVMQLKEQGKLDLEENINTYLSTFQVPLYHDQPITLHHLLTHTAGLDEALYGITSLSPSGALSGEEYLQRYVRKQPPVRPPGSEYAYSNAGLGLAARIVEEVSGSDFSDYLSSQLFQPLQMPAAALNAGKSPEMAVSYAIQQGEARPLDYSFINLPGAGGVSTTPAEWAHFMIAHLNGGSYQGASLLRPETVGEMHERQYAEHPDLPGVGYGFFRSRSENGLLTLWHRGDVDGFSAKMELVPSHQVGIFVISNAPAQSIPLHDRVTEAVISLLAADGSTLDSASSGGGATAGSGATSDGVTAGDTSAGGATPGHVTPDNADTTIPSSPPSSPVLSSEEAQMYARTYTMTLGPEHGWGRWLRWLGARDYKVTAAGQQLHIEGIFPDGSGEQETKVYTPLGGGLFQEQGGKDSISFHRQEGVWKMSFTQGVTMAESPPWWRHPSVALLIYVAGGLLWAVLFFTGVVRRLVRFILRRRQLPADPVMGIALLFTIYLPGQLLYGNSEIFTRGYPAWYAWGFSSLPLLAAAWAVYIGMQTIHGHRTFGRRLHTIFTLTAVILCLLYTMFLFYWNMLPLHYS